MFCERWGWTSQLTLVTKCNSKFRRNLFVIFFEIMKQVSDSRPSPFHCEFLFSFGLNFWLMFQL